MRFLYAASLAVLLATVGCAPAGGPGDGPNAGTKARPKTVKPGDKPKAGPVKPEPPRPVATRPDVSRAGVSTYYMRAGKAYIAYSADDSEGSGLDLVEIWISRNGGKWELFKEDKELKGRVIFEAKEEGVFDFVSVGVDKIGNREKDLAENSRPHFRVVVDRTPPTVVAKAPPRGALASAGGTFEYSWEAKDAHLAEGPVSIEVKMGKSPEWKPVASGLAARGRDKFTLPTAEDDVAEVRFSAKDLAGNVGVAAAGKVAFDRVAPTAKIVGPRTANDLVVKVKYTVADAGAAAVSRVTLWISEDRGRRWSKLTDAPPKSGEVEVRLPRAGSYGLAISAVDTVGNAQKPPKRGTRPSFEISTDKVPPVLEALKWVTKGQVVSARKGIEIQWKATDKNIGAKPVSIEFSFNGGRNWVAVGMNREAAGKLNWTPPDRIDSRRCMLRLVARDLLGNESQLTSSPFTVDNKPPVTNSRFEKIEPEAGKGKPAEGPVPLKPPATRKGRR